IVDVQEGEPVYAKTANREAGITSHVRPVYPGGDLGLSVTGSNLTPLGIWDDGPVRATHQEFDGRVTVRSSGEPTSHGTHVGGTMVAAGVNERAQGMAYEARLTSYNWNNVLSQMASEAANNGMLVSQHSYTMGNSFQYDRLAQQWDDLHLNYPFKLGSKSAGNDGEWRAVRDAGNAKNNITIGAINNIQGGWANPGNVRIANFSSRGPTRNDRRVKPDLVAKGVQVYSTGHRSDNDYTSMSGTSMAGPAAAGMLGLLQDHYFETHDRTYMRAATLKAVAINTAGDAGTEGPNATFGWGVVHVARGAQLITNNDGGNEGLIRELTLQNNETLEFEYVGNGEEEIVATIVWPDPSGARLVNDLDLRVIVDGETHMPWRIDSGNELGAAVRGDNTVDNVEKVNTGVTRGGASVTVQVSHKGSLSGGSQNFSLAISGVGGGDPKILTLLSPETGDVLQANSEHTVRWESEGDIENVHLEWGHVGGTWSTVAESVPNTGEYTWSVPDTAHDDCRFRITDADGNANDISGAYEIEKAEFIRITEPDSGDQLAAGEEYAIRWDSEGDLGDLHIEWGHRGGNFSTVAESVPNTGEYTWNVPDTAHDQCVLRISQVSGDVSDRLEYFTIFQVPEIEISPMEIETSLRPGEEYQFDVNMSNHGKGDLQLVISQSSTPESMIDGASWSASADDYGSYVDVAEGVIQSGAALMEYHIVEQPDEDSWPWATMTASLERSFTGLEEITVRYASDHDVNVLLDQSGLSQNGTSHRALLPARSSLTDTVLSISEDFEQPQWIIDAGEETPLDLGEVSSMSFSVAPDYSTVTEGSLQVDDLALDGVELPQEETPVHLSENTYVIPGESEELLPVTLTAEGFDLGTYGDTLHISHNDPARGPLAIPVVLQVQANEIPEFDPVEQVHSLDVGDDLDLIVSASDPEDDALFFDITGLPDWLSANTEDEQVVIRGTAEEAQADQTYDFTVEVYDDFEPERRNSLDITVSVGSAVEIIHVDTISTTSTTPGVYPVENPGSLQNSSYDFAVVTGDPAMVRVIIYDNLGNVLDEQTEQSVPGTGHVLSWDMRNSRGSRVGPGSYLIVAEVEYANGTTQAYRRLIGLRNE
ncbi:S8 family serine peptidase, partial [Chitinivibrio alkaliphilus]|uniref:S8 family serine peptidase n=1 Tax=Chitinivibrio alkaliphilus TaxID=1505232 RepID=UPI00138AD908